MLWAIWYHLYNFLNCVHGTKSRKALHNICWSKFKQFRNCWKKLKSVMSSLVKVQHQKMWIFLKNNTKKIIAYIINRKLIVNFWKQTGRVFQKYYGTENNAKNFLLTLTCFEGVVTFHILQPAIKISHFFTTQQNTIICDSLFYLKHFFQLKHVYYK